MKHPLHIIIHAPLREKRDFRLALVGLKNGLCVTLNGAISTYDLLPLCKPRKGQEHQILEVLSQQIEQGWAIAVWDAERLLTELEQIVDRVRSDRPKLLPAIEAAWAVISSADEEQIVDLRSFRKLPGGHYVTMIAAREDYDFDDLPPRRRRRLMAYRPKARPVSEDFWGVLHRVIMGKAEAERAWAAYQRWVAKNRPKPPRADLGVESDAKQEPSHCQAVGALRRR